MSLHQKLNFETDKKLTDTCKSRNKNLIEQGSLTESDCYNHVTTMVQYTTNDTNTPINKVLVCSSNGAQPVMKSLKVCLSCLSYFFLFHDVE